MSCHYQQEVQLGLTNYDNDEVDPLNLHNLTLYEQQTKKVMFYIEDTGIGIKEEDQGKLFKIFGKLEQGNKNINP